MVSLHPTLARYLERIRNYEKALKLPANVLVAALVLLIPLIIVFVQSTVLSGSVKEGQVRVMAAEAVALKAAVEELTQTQQEDRAEMLRLKESLKAAQREKKELEVWTAHANESRSSGETAAAVLLVELGEVAHVLTGGAKRPLSAEALAEKLNVSTADVSKAQGEGARAAALSSGSPSLLSFSSPLSLMLLAARAQLQQLREGLEKRMAEVRAESDASQKGGAELEQCKALVAKREAVKDGKMSAEDALAECAELALNQSALAHSMRRAVARKSEKLLDMVMEASGSKDIPATLKEELETTKEICQLSIPPMGLTRSAAAAVPSVQAAAPGPAGIPLALSTTVLCNATDEEIGQYLNYTADGLCPDDWWLVQHLIFDHNCHSLPRRRCFAPNWPEHQEPLPLPGAMWNESALLDSNVHWRFHHCKSFQCLKSEEGAVPDCPDCYDWAKQRERFNSKVKNQVSMSEALLAKNGTMRIGVDLGGGTGSFAALMAEHNVTIVTTGWNGEVRNNVSSGVPFMETVALRGLVPLHMPHNQRLPFFDATIDIIHAASSVDGMAYDEFEDALFDWDRILRPGGLVWFSLFHSQVRLMPQYMDIVDKFKYKYIHRTVTPSVRQDGLHVFVNFLIEKPKERDISEPLPAPFE